MKQGDTVVARLSQCQFLSGVLMQRLDRCQRSTNAENVCKRAFVKNTAGRFDGSNVKTQNTEYLQGFGGWPVLILDSLRTACNGMKHFFFFFLND